MRTCFNCKQTKPITDFYTKGTRLQNRCKSCFNSYCTQRWRDKKIAVITQFGNQCKDCKISYHPNVYEFHHLDPKQKEYSWHKMRLFSHQKMQKELNKCIMLCANCHRLRHI